MVHEPARHYLDRQQSKDNFCVTSSVITAGGSLSFAEAGMNASYYTTPIQWSVGVA
jgi:hypothetical protein